MEAINTAKAAKLTETVYIVSADERERIMAARDNAQERVAELDNEVASYERTQEYLRRRLDMSLNTVDILRDELDASDNEIRGCTFIDEVVSLVIVGVVTGGAFAVTLALLEYLG